MPELLSAFLLAVFAQGSVSTAAQTATVQARAVVREAQLAIEGDSVARVRARWLRRSMPADERTALALATLARLTYAYGDADARYLALERGSQRARGGTGAFGVYAMLGRAQSYATRWRTDSAVIVLGRVLRAARAARDSVAETEALLVLARIDGRTAGTDSAARTLQRAEEMVPAREAGLKADVRCARARLLSLRNAVAADSAVDVALRLAESSGEARVLGRCMVIRAAVRENRGSQALAREAGLEAVRILLRARDLDFLAVALQFMAYHGVSYSTNFAAARAYADSAIVTGNRAGNPLPVAWAQLNLAQIALRFVDTRAASRHTEAANALFVRLGDRLGIAAAASLRGEANHLSGRLTEARAAYARADSLYTALGFVGARAPILLRTAGVLRERGRLDEAQQALDEAVRLATAMRFEGITQTDQHYERGLLALDRHDYAAAVRAFEAFRTGLGPGGAHYHYDAQARIAEALTGQGRLAAAESVLIRVAHNLDELRLQHTNREAQLAVLENRRFDFDTDLGFATIVHRFATAGRTDAALRIAEDRRARHLWTAMLRRQALRNDETPRSAARMARLLPGGSLDVRQLASTLPASTALLEYVTGRGGEPSTLFVLTRRGLTAHTLPSADSLVDDIGTFVTALEGGSPARSVARRLGSMLLAPALSALGGVTRLVIVPDGPLHRLPFDALELADRRPALLQYTISLSPSARIAASGWLSANGPRSGSMLAVGDPAYDRSSGLPRLPASGREARAAASHFADARILLGARASEAALTRSRLSDVRVLHLATHAEVEDFGLLRSTLALAPGDGEDGRLGVADIAALDLDADLVVLSGCRTAGGVVVTGEGIQGLVGPFLEAGARTVVATQWAVGDRSIAPLIARFYRELRAGRTVAEALRVARVALRTSGAPPSVWAAVVLTGNADLRLFAPRTTAARR